MRLVGSWWRGQILYELCHQLEGGMDAFAKGVEEIVSEFHGRRKQRRTLGAVRIGDLLNQVLDL